MISWEYRGYTIRVSTTESAKIAAEVEGLPVGCGIRVEWNPASGGSGEELVKHVRDAIDTFLECAGAVAGLLGNERATAWLNSGKDQPHSPEPIASECSPAASIPDPAPQFRVGDMVRLKSDGGLTRLTIVDIEDGEATVAWQLANGHYDRDSFPVAALVAA